MSFKRSVAHLFHPRRSNNFRSRLLHPEYLLLLAFIALASFGSVSRLQMADIALGSVLGYASDISVDQVVAQTNQQRATAGLGAVTYNATLSNAAAGKARDMFSNQYWAHTSPTGKEPWDFMAGANYRYTIAGENLARDFMDTSSMVQAWMASPTHRANIMNARYKDIGVAVVNGQLNGVETTLVVQMFGDPISSAPKAAAVPQVAPATTSVELATIEVAADIPAQAEPTQENEVAGVEQPVVEQQEVIEQQPTEVLSTVVVPTGELQAKTLLAPVYLWKAGTIAIALLLIGTLMYDGLVARQTKLARVVGNNLGHIALLAVVIFIALFFKAGSIG